MDIHMVALANLVALAQVDGKVSVDEIALIERYRVALRLPENALDQVLDESLRAPLSSTQIEGSREERLSVMKMMIRVAFADGSFCPRERRRLERVSISLGIEPLTYADLLVEVESTLAQKKSTRRGLSIIGSLAVFSLLAAGFLSIWNPFAPLLDPRTLLAVDPEFVLQATDDISSFKHIEKKYSPSILLIVVWYDLVKGEERVGKSGAGSGFFVSSTGHIATSKHLVQPWKFKPEVVHMIQCEGYRVDTDSLRIAAWPGETDLRAPSGKLNLRTAYSTHSTGLGRLQLYSLAKDLTEMRRESLPDGRRFEGEFHQRNNDDLAILKAEVKRPVLPFRIYTLEDHGLEKLDAIMVMGYPAGLKILESDIAMPSPSTGTIRKVEETIFLTNSILAGNSGSPAVTSRGSAVGVVTRYVADPTLSCCIRSHHLLELLPTASQLLAEAGELEENGYPGAALDHFALALCRSPSESQEKRIQKSCYRIFTRRNQLLREQESFQTQNNPSAARKIEQQLEDQYGCNWILPRTAQEGPLLGE